MGIIPDGAWVWAMATEVGFTILFIVLGATGMAIRPITSDIHIIMGTPTVITPIMGLTTHIPPREAGVLIPVGLAEALVVAQSAMAPDHRLQALVK